MRQEVISYQKNDQYDNCTDYRYLYIAVYINRKEQCCQPGADPAADAI